MVTKKKDIWLLLMKNDIQKMWLLKILKDQKRTLYSENTCLQVFLPTFAIILRNY